MTASVHPLFGQALPANGLKRWKGEILLVVVLPDGSPGTIALSATSLSGEDAAVGPSTVLSLDGVRHLRSLVATLGRRRASTVSPKTRK